MTRLLVVLLTALAGTALAPTAAPSIAAAPAAAVRAATPATAVPATSQRRAARQCQGKRATLVGRPGKTLRGTRKRDVVVTNGADYVTVGQGNDLVCVTGGREAQVAAGPGNDTVVVKQRRGDVTAVLDRGRDTFLGGPGDDHVYGSGMATNTRDGHRDVIRTRGGDDLVATGRFDRPSADRVGLGAGDDELWLYSVDNRGGRLRGGTGDDRLVYMADKSPDPAAEWVVDASTGTLSDRGTTLARFGGFNTYYLQNLDGVSQHFIGSSSGETWTPSPRTVVSAAMGGGDDSIEVFHFSSAPLDTSGAGLDGGAGRDYVLMQELAHAVDGDLATQRITVAPADPASSYVVPLAGIEDLALSSYETVTMTGDDGPNRLWGYSCGTRISGGGGDDVLRSQGFVEDIECASRPAQLYGGDGDDTLVGGRHDDVLDGGAGNDSADGDRGTDTCLAEIRRRCEG